MPAPITVLRTGTGWTIDVTALALSSSLPTKDFYVKLGVVVSPLASYTKTSQVLLTYTGTSLAANTPVTVYRDSTRIVPDLLFNEINTSGGLNSRFDVVELVLEDLRQLFTTLF